MSEPEPGRALVPVDEQRAGAELAQVLLLARAFAASGYFADARAEAQAVVKIQAGRELGFGPMASMVGIHLVKGHVTLSANLIASAIRRSGHYDYRVAELTDQSCTITFIQHGKAITDVIFTMDDARRAGLASNDVWKKYPRNMLFARCISNLARWYCPDIFTTGVYADGELDDCPEPLAVSVQVTDARPGRSETPSVRPGENAAAHSTAAAPPRPEPPAGGNGQSKMTTDEAAALADLCKQLFQGRGIIDQKPADKLWREILARWGVTSPKEMDPVQRKQLVSYLVTQIQADQMQAELEGETAAAAAGGR